MCQDEHYPNDDLFRRFGLDATSEPGDLNGRPYRPANGPPLRVLFVG